MKLWKAVAAIVFGLAVIVGPWSVPTDTAVQQSTMDRPGAAGSVVDQKSVVDEGLAVAGAPRTIELSPQCWCVEYGMTSVPVGSVTKQV